MQEKSNRQHCSGNDGDVTRQAAEWFAILLDESATANDRVEFRAWLERNPEHVAAYCELERLWLGASALPEVMPISSQRRRKILKSGGALAILAATGAGSAIYLQPASSDYRTGIGETGRFTLPDGSVAELSTASAIALNFTSQQRQVVLQQGEAFFTVAPEAGRPFVVEHQQVRSTALGTQFSVGADDGAITVAVAEHKVRVSALTQQQDVEEGQSVRFANGRLSLPAHIDVGTQVSWRDGRLVFISTPFEEVVAALARWRRGKMIVMDKALARRPVSIIVDVRRAGRILENLEHGLPIRIASYSPLLTLIYPR